MLIEKLANSMIKKKYINNFFNVRVAKTLETPSEMPSV